MKTETGFTGYIDLEEKERIVHYDFEELRRIPILSVAEDIGLELRQRGGKYWCKVRSEDHNPSCILHEDTNRFYDFGTNVHGDVIAFAGYVFGLDVNHAQEWLGKQYGFVPKYKKQESSHSNAVAPWEYEAIGLASDLATKNFRFETDHLPMDILHKISNRYAMPMNELRVRYPKTYAKILSEKAIPYVRSMRNDYLLSVWSMYQLLKELGAPELFSSKCQSGVFRKQIQELEKAEHALQKAIKGTNLKGLSPQKHDPEKDLEALMAGKLKPRLGTLSFDEMQRRSEEAHEEVKYFRMEYVQYGLNEKLLDFPHTAFLSSGKVIIGYLRGDHEAFLDAIASDNLSTKIEDAARRSTQKEGEVPSEKEFSK